MRAVDDGSKAEDAWVDNLNRCTTLLRQVDSWCLEARCRNFLVCIVAPVSRFAHLQEYAYALLARGSEPREAGQLARAVTRTRYGFVEIDVKLRRLIVELAPHAHAARLVFLSCYQVPPDKTSIDILEALPPPLRRRVLRRWRRAFLGAELPWTSDWRRLRDSRPADRLRALLFDYG